MKLYEYQGRELFTAYGIPISPGSVASTADGAYAASKELGGPCVVKAQVLVGGRGKAGGVKVAKTSEEAREKAGQILGMTIKSLPVNKVLVTRIEHIEREYYLGLAVDRTSKAIALIASASGGVDIEDLARNEPERIYKLAINPLKGLDEGACRNLLETVFSDKGQSHEAFLTVQKIFKLFVENDCTLVEINPYALITGGGLVAVDSKIVIDESGVFKHEQLEAMRNREEYGPDELEAREYGLSFINMDGNIGCIVNGAGLAMATMDIIKLFGGNPANFLDVGGSSSPEKVLHAFEIIMRNSSVRIILINIFGGITRCDDIAKGILKSKEEMELSVPLVIRLIGTNEKEGRALLKNAGIDAYDDLTEAVKRAVEAAG
jgi:succinyl-CoA synthetase beta subunit